MTKIRVWEPLNKNFHYPKLGLYQGTDQLRFILPSGEQSLYRAYTSMNLDAVIVEYGIEVDEEVFHEGDIVTGYFGYFHEGIGVVRFGEYEQDGSGGEYSSHKCYGFYVERIKIILNEWEDQDDIVSIINEDCYKTVSIFDFSYRIIGNIHEHPDSLI